ncbi:hypothetical protein E0L36_25750 [Streptomyces sp. AJS327]|uniref:L,D-transpeptidase n=1 Tax=Streptomyces sp. AJS327 TaxID=2545265 RepID=UPI0015DF00E0|nr:L,D-transpeptidase [Streptomyces sp. AJS327]MBA0054132.1 hypothetical protein [Streptomyces sp. AJS327]
MTALTAGALAIIGFFAYQASAAQDDASARKPPPSSSPSKDAKDSPKERAEALPADSGNGKRVVYALKRQRVWLVDKGDKVVRTFKVTPSAVNPPPGGYRVESRAAHVTGSDGVPVENVVRFATVQGTTVGFSAAIDGTMPERETGQRTGGVRESRPDGEAMWRFTMIGTKVVVVR